MQRTIPHAMVLGPAAAAPLGYLRFCARRPDQCGLDAPTAGNGATFDPEARARALFARYYWLSAFQNAGAGDLKLDPTSGPVPQAAAPQSDLSGAYDWASLFSGAGRPPKPTHAAIAAPAATPAPMQSAEPAAPIIVPDPLSTTPALMATLDGVNQRINRAIRYVADEVQYGTPDYWTLPLEAGGPAAGDCKDYVLEKRRALVAAGIPAGDLSIAIVRTWRGETHAVLLVSTDKGELVLDSLSSWIRPWRDVGYTWVERQAPGQQLVWLKIDAAS